MGDSVAWSLAKNKTFYLTFHSCNHSQLLWFMNKFTKFVKCRCQLGFPVHSLHKNTSEQTQKWLAHCEELPVFDLFNENREPVMIKNKLCIKTLRRFSFSRISLQNINLDFSRWIRCWNLFARGINRIVQRYSRKHLESHRWNMTNQNPPGSNWLEDKVNQSGKKRNKARLPIVQRLSFSVGHFLNDAVVGAWVSYILIFQTKVLGISNSTAGFLWVVPSSIDAVTSLLVGYVCDNFKFPLFAKYYGKRKSFHLLGTILVAALFPFLMMPCFVCGEDSSEWKLGIYYGAIMVTLNVGWALSQVTHLALIPEIAKRPNEMVELHALRWVQFQPKIYVSESEVSPH